MFKEFCRKIKNMKLTTLEMQRMPSFERRFIADELNISMDDVETYRRRFLSLSLKEKHQLKRG